MSDPNLNHLHARIAVEECVRRGCRTIVVCPGSRSAPLAAAAATWRSRVPTAGEGAVDVMVAHDERGAAFLALGAARVTGRAALVITTSGTAVANLLPAAVEASMDGIPMLLFTADRPPELHGCGANQAVPQRGMLAPVARAAFDVPCPDDPSMTPLAVLDAVASAWERAHGIGGPAGPVHVNWRFREPLAPVKVRWSLVPSVQHLLSEWERSSRPWRCGGDRPVRCDGAVHQVPCEQDQARPSGSRAGWPALTTCSSADLCARLSVARRGLVVAGGVRSPSEASSLARIARALPWPVIADIASGLRGGAPPSTTVHHADLALCAHASGDRTCHSPDAVGEALRPDVILRVGGRIASKRVQQWLDECVAAGSSLAVVGDGADPMDPSCSASAHVRAGLDELAEAMVAHATSFAPSEVAEAWRAADSAVAAALAALDGEDCDGAVRVSEPWIARAALREAHHAGAIAMLSSSMPVRDADMHADRTCTPRCIANRGASGIDGIVATAAGACRASGQPVLLLIGDVAALHDLSSWSLLRDLPAPICVTIVNNDGGGIFQFLPIAEHTSIYSPWFDSPHGLTFDGAASMFSLEHVAVGEGAACASAIRRALGGERRERGGPARHRASIVEVQASAQRIVPDHRGIQAVCASAVRDALAAGLSQGSGR